MNTGASESGAIRAEKRGPRTREERRRIVEEMLVPGTSVMAVARAHEVNTNQLYHWRKLYRQGLLEEAPMTTLMPVKVSDGEQESVATKSSGAKVNAGSMPDTEEPGTIHIEIGDARVRIEGKADLITLGVVMEQLLR